MKTTLLFVVSIGLLISCARNPVTGKRELAIGEKQEMALGASSDPQIIATMGTYDDKELNAFLTNVGKQMAAKSHRPDLDWTFRIVDSDVVNAFAVPGGYVYFTRGILAHFNNEAEFAGVLGHEIGHVTARHSAQQIRRQQLAQVGMIAGAIAVPEIAQNLESINQGMQLLFLKYGRDAESESDALGVEYSTLLAYDANEMARFFKTIHRLQKQAGVDIPTFLSTHPDPLNREANVRALAKEWQGKTPGTEDKVNRDGYLDLIEGLVYGKDPNQGYEEAGNFYHPPLKFVFTIPQNYRVVNTTQQVQMASEKGDAVVNFTLAQGESPRAAATAWMQKNQVQSTRQRAVTINGLPGYEVQGIAGGGQAQNGQQQQRIAWKSTFISYDNRIYQFTEMTLAELASKYASRLGTPTASFRKLSDPKYLNRKPERIRIKTVPSNQTMQAFLKTQGVASSRHQEFAILNGVELNTMLIAGTKVKLVGF